MRRWEERDLELLYEALADADDHTLLRSVLDKEYVAGKRAQASTSRYSALLDVKRAILRRAPYLKGENVDYIVQHIIEPMLAKIVLK